MKILTLAAGRGSRLAHQTQSKPKCMTAVQGKTILHWQQASQSQAGVTHKAAVLGYKANQIERLFDTSFLNEDWQGSNMVSSLLCANDYFCTNPVVISYSDIVYHPSDLRSLHESQGDIVVAYDKKWLEQWSLRFDEPLSDAETFKLSKNKKNIIEIGYTANSLDEIEGQFLGLIKVTPEGWRIIKQYLKQYDNSQIAKLDMTGLLQELIEANIDVYGHEVHNPWFEIDSLNDLSVANNQSALFSWSHCNE